MDVECLLLLTCREPALPPAYEFVCDWLNIDITDLSSQDDYNNAMYCTVNAFTCQTTKTTYQKVLFLSTLLARALL